MNETSCLFVLLNLTLCSVLSTRVPYRIGGLIGASVSEPHIDEFAVTTNTDTYLFIGYCMATDWQLRLDEQRDSECFHLFVHAACIHDVLLYTACAHMLEFYSLRLRMTVIYTCTHSRSPHNVMHSPSSYCSVLRY